MSCEKENAVIDALVAAVSGPQHVQTDAGSFTGYSVSDLIKAASYLAGSCAGQTRRRGVRFNRLIPDGPVHGRRRHIDGGFFNSGW